MNPSTLATGFISKKGHQSVVVDATRDELLGYPGAMRSAGGGTSSDR